MGNLFSCVLICGATEKVKIVHSDISEEADFRVVLATQQVDHTQGSSRHVIEVEHKNLNTIATGEAQLSTPVCEQEDQEIYFLIPVDISTKSHVKTSRLVSLQPYKYWSIGLDRTKQLDHREAQKLSFPNPPVQLQKHDGVTKLVVSKRYLAQILMEKKLRRQENKDADTRSEEPKTTQHNHSRSRFSRAGTWKPALESISEIQTR
ncbi:hypothetical protein O6H91_07G047900 [Diphasiastrum complanatum]|uniref:Uncharacterized protein n=1 Tax=Diphasiastrum complanatum TaxID=34168 RepID=A0ACC2D4Z7_DIPCM|nr:hypothetical protein O6H91_07G047900 [Diphasiastrum complanatum]